MYKKIFELINEEINSILVNENSYEFKKLELRGNKVKFVFLNTGSQTVKVINYELDFLGPEPKLKLKNDYIKPFKDKYFR